MRTYMYLHTQTDLLSEITPPVGQKAVQWFWELFAKLVLHWLVRPFVLLFFGLTLTCSLACLGRINIGMDPTIALPKVSNWVPTCLQNIGYLLRTYSFTSYTTMQTFLSKCANKLCRLA